MNKSAMSNGKSVKTWNAFNQEIVACEQCERLRQYCQSVAEKKRRAYIDEQYWGKPVPNFGDPAAELLIVGLAPAAHGANRTGRMFTGDRSGDWLFRALYKAGFANQPNGNRSDDGLQLINCAITATCHCAPPENKPTKTEIANCEHFLEQTVTCLPVKVYLALGQIGWRAVIDYARRHDLWNQKLPKFSHCAHVRLENGCWLLGSYHPSQQNTFTGKLTEAMFDGVFEKARDLLV